MAGDSSRDLFIFHPAQSLNASVSRFCHTRFSVLLFIYIRLFAFRFIIDSRSSVCAFPRILSLFLSSFDHLVPFLSNETKRNTMVGRNKAGARAKDFERDVRSPRNSQESQLTPAGSRDLRGGEDKQDVVKEEGGGEESRHRKKERKKET